MSEGLKESEKLFWHNYLSTLPSEQRPFEPFVTASPAGDLDITDGLINLYLEGKKTAGSSIVEDFLTAGDELPEVGDYWILLDSKEEPVLLLETIETETHNWLDVPERVAVAEGEGDLSLTYWRQVHGELYTPFLHDWGLTDLNQARVITEHFKVVFKRKK